MLWRVPRLRGLTWVMPEPGTESGWIGASTVEGADGGILRFGPDGVISRLSPDARPMPRTDWERRRIAPDVTRTRAGRLLFLEHQAIAILSADGRTLTRVEGFRVPRK